MQMPHQKITNRAGFRESEMEKTTYYVLPEVFNVELCAGFDKKLVESVCIEEGWLIRGKDRVTPRRDSLRWERNGSICLPIACWVMKIKMAIFVGNSGNAGTLLSFISICSHVPMKEL